MATTMSGGAVPPPPPPTSIGIIFPPADIRGIVDKTAAFVAKNGVEFEQRVVREQSNQRFAFLQLGNPYRPYYEMKVKEHQTGEVGKSSAPAVPQAIQDMQRREEERAKKKEQLLMLTQHADTTQDIKPPKSDKFSVNHPPISPVDLDIIKVTAQFVARNGKKFLVGLTQRERNNPQFEFLQPSHFLFKYFTALIDTYTKCLLPDKAYLEKVQADAAKGSGSDILQRCHMRYLWNSKVEKEKEEKEKQLEDERMQMQNIDWHDFEVVETIEFTSEDESCDLPEPFDFSGTQQKPPPISLGARPCSAGGTVIDKDRMIRDEVEMEIEEGVEIAAAAAGSDRLSENLIRGVAEIVVPAPPAIGDAAAVEKSAPGAQEALHMAREGVEVASAPAGEFISYPIPLGVPSLAHKPSDGGKIVVVKDYVRQSKRRQMTAMPSATQICPITGHLVPCDEMTNHLRILLLDPKWKEQKDKLMLRARKETAFAPELDVEDNLAQFVARRPDLFGSVEDEIQEHTAETVEM